MRLPTTVNRTDCWSPLQRESIPVACIVLHEYICPSAFISSSYSCERITPTLAAPRPAVNPVNVQYHVELEQSSMSVSLQLYATLLAHAVWRSVEAEDSTYAPRH